MLSYLIKLIQLIITNHHYILKVGLLLYLLINYQKAESQQNQKYYAEKIYIQTDSQVYTPGEIVWFTCVVVNSQNHTPTELSRVIYLELVGADEDIVQKKIINLDKGFGNGFLHLNKELQDGVYQLRAYAKWNENFAASEIFTKYIHVFNGHSNGQIKPYQNLSIIQLEDGSKSLQVSISPEHLSKNKLSLHIDIDGNKDSLIVKKNKNDKYRCSLPIAKDSRLATLQFTDDNNRKYTKTILLSENELDLSFYPEGGTLIQGIASKVGFKVKDATGRGVLVEGIIADEKDSIISRFKSNALGLGYFILDYPDTLKNYYAQILGEKKDSVLQKFNIPNVSSVGSVLAVSKKKDNIIFSVRSTALSTDSLLLQVSSRSQTYIETPVEFKKRICNISIASSALPEGIIECFLINSADTLSSRLFFNEDKSQRLKLKIKADKKEYNKRELAEINIQVLDSSLKPAQVKLSVKVLNKKYQGDIERFNSNILSNHLLTSELKEGINKPGFYFKTDKNMHHHLDALMLTQIKSNRKLSSEDVLCPPEYNLSVSGHVGGSFATQKRKQAHLTMLTTGDKPSAYLMNTDTSGVFKFDIKDEFGDHMNVIFQSQKKSGKQVNYTIQLNKNESPPIFFNHLKSVIEPDTIIKTIAAKKSTQQRVDEAFPLQSGNIMIDEIEITAYDLTEQRKEVLQEYGEAEEVIDGKVIQEKEQKWSYGLYSVLMFNYPELLSIDDRGPFLFARVHGSDATLVVVDGKPVSIEEYELIPNIPPGQVESFEIIKCASSFNKLYEEVIGVYPEGVLCGSVIAIYTHGRKGIYGTSEPVGIMHTVIPVFSSPREFKTPQYDTDEMKASKKPDLRTVLYWNPEIDTDSSGNAQFSFYNGDIGGDMIIVVEAISENGKLGYQEFNYKVKGTDNDFIFIE